MRKILTWHPLGKSGVYVPKKDYEIISDFILSTLDSEELTLLDLIERGECTLAQQLEGNIAWQILVVKLDLEARGIIVSFLRLAPHKSQFLKLRKKGMKRFIAKHDASEINRRTGK